MRKLFQLAAVLIFGAVLGFVAIRNVVSLIWYLWSWIKYLLSFFSRDLIVSVIWFGLGCGHVFFSYTFIVFDKPYPHNITELIEEYQNIQDDKLKMENLVKSYYEEKILRKNITDPRQQELLRSKTLWNIPVKKREKILNKSQFTMLEEGESL